MRFFLQNPKKYLLINAIIIAVLAVGFAVWCLICHFELSKMGLAEANFPWSRFSVAELASLYKQEPSEGVVITQTPEQTHEKFMTALRARDYEEAVDCCVVKSKRAEYLKLFQDVETKGLTDVMIGDLSEIKLEMDLGVTRTYVFAATSGNDPNEKVAGTISFIKNTKGVYLIQSL